MNQQMARNQDMQLNINISTNPKPSLHNTMPFWNFPTPVPSAPADSPFENAVMTIMRKNEKKGKR